MSNVSSDWRPVSAWTGIASEPMRHGRADVSPAVTITPLEHADIVTLISVEGGRARFDMAVKDLWGLEVPAAGRMSLNEVCTLVWSGPNQWLAIPNPYDFASLAVSFDGAAAASEQGDGRALVEISGPAARDALAKGLAIDLHPAAFSSGCVAVTALSHLSVQIWQTDDAPTYVLSVPRTVAGHVWEWLLESTAEFGCDVTARR